MNALAAALLIVPLVDQTMKRLLHRCLGSGSVAFGPFGALRIVTSRIWWTRLHGGPSLTATWSLWLMAAGVLAFATAVVPSFGWFAGLLLGGSLSHSVESSLRGCVTDYVCLRFWPAFNLADVAILAGALGIVRQMFDAVASAW